MNNDNNKKKKTREQNKVTISIWKWSGWENDGIKEEIKTEDVREEKSKRDEGEKKKDDKRWGWGVKGLGARQKDRQKVKQKDGLQREQMVRKIKRDASEKKEREQTDSEGWQWLMVTFLGSTRRWMFNAVTAPHDGK